MMKLNRYSASGSTQRNGITATSWHILLVVASRSTDAQAGSSSHRRRSRAEGRVGLAHLWTSSFGLCSRLIHTLDPHVLWPSTDRGRRGATDGIHGQSPSPQRRLRFAGEMRLEIDRIADQREQRADIRERVKPVGRGAWMRAAEPVLHQGTSGRQDEIRQANAYGQQAENLQGRIPAPAPASRCRRG